MTVSAQDLSPLEQPAWRLVEAQHIVSTLKLVDGLDEQQLLEQILEETKPSVPADCEGLDYLLSTPFRYRAYPKGSRFRRAGLTPGVWYGSERAETAVAEMVFYRFLFYAESPKTPFPDNAADYTAFSVSLRTDHAIDLARGALAAQTALWTHPSDYGPCQDLADAARVAGAEVIRYRSVRDPSAGANFAVLTCRAFASRAPTERQSWRIKISHTGAQVMRDHPRTLISFPTDAFGRDQRLAGMDWNRGGGAFTGRGQ